MEQNTRKRAVAKDLGETIDLIDCVRVQRSALLISGAIRIELSEVSAKRLAAFIVRHLEHEAASDA